MPEKEKRNFGEKEPHLSNVLRLVKALLLLAKGGLTLEDSRLEAAVKVAWVAEDTLKVTGEYKEKTRRGEKVVEGTTRQALWQLVEKTDTPLELPQRRRENSSPTKQERQKAVVRNALDYLKYLEVWKDASSENKRNTNTKSEIFTLTLKHKNASLEENLGVVKQKLGLETSPPTDKSIDWQNICRIMLEKQKQLTTNRLMRADEMLFDIDRIVDLALVERKQTDKRSEDDNPERSHLYKPDYEETQKLEYKDFLTKVLNSEQSKKIAIIGEPGAGKTTLLQRIAFWILENTDDLPIWIPLGNFPNPAPKFKDYLLNDWLEDAIPSVTPKIKAEFEELLMAGKVWLLLDGVDEMAAKSGSPLTVIANRIVGWCDRLRVVLTCRLNVWEANPYSLNGFQTYRTLEFSQEKVEEFIKACFQKSNPKLGVQLQQALNQPGKERIKDLVRNPLRLMLLCSTWHLRDGKLPDTKAGLYQQLVEEVYRWKKEEFPTTPEERKQLNAKLKELALAAIDKEENRFCLRHKFVEGVLGNRDGFLFQLALNIGWVNQVGVDAKNPNPNQPVYAFFHPTFQEYFAALAIDDWGFFLPRAHDNRNPKPVSERYRIFEPQWKEVILLWLGREEVAKEQKEQFIQALVKFEDGCKDFFWYRAYFLAADGIAEFEDCNLADEIVAQIIDWGFNAYVTFLDPVEERARKALRETNRRTMVSTLTNLLHTDLDENAYLEIAMRLGEIEPGNSEAINSLIKLLELPPIDEHNHWIAIYQLGNIGRGSSNSNAINSLRELLHSTQYQEIIWRAATSLGKIDTGNLEAINILASLSRNSEDESIRLATACNLAEINPGNSEAMKTLTELLNDSHEQEIRLLAASNLKKFGTGHLDAINIQSESRCFDSLILIEPIYTEQDGEISQEDEWSLGEIEPDRWESVNTLINLVRNTSSEDTLFSAAWSLREICQDDFFPVAVTGLKDYLKDQVDEDNFDRDRCCYAVLWHCAQNMTYPNFYQAWHQQEGVDNTTTSGSKSLNQTDLPQSLQSAIANDLQLSQTIHLICIDRSQFIEPDRPAAEIYDQMLDQNCPECAPVPETMPALKRYWNSLKRKSDKLVISVFYTSSSNLYSEAFLTALSKFGGGICVITGQHFEHIPLKFLAPSQTIEDAVKWIREKVMEE